MPDFPYNGWTNRETWALNLWLSNDEGLYNLTRERVADWLARYPEDAADKLMATRRAGEAVKEAWEELTDPDEGLMTAENILKMVRDVGSEYRVDWDEIGRHWLEDVTEERAGECAMSGKLAPGAHVIKSGYPGVVIREYLPDMYEVRLSSGDVVVPRCELRATDDPAENRVES